MARKLKTFQTSLGFFDLAIAAPSMKAALEAWGADSNLFHQGAARETDDPDVVAATMAAPGVVLKRPVGSGGSSRRMPNCRPISSANDVRGRGRARRREVSRQDSRSSPQIRQPTGRLLRPMQRKRSAAGANATGKKPSDRRTASDGSAPSTRRRPPSMPREKSTTRKRPRSVRRSRRSKSDCETRMPIGKRNGRVWMICCAEHASRRCDCWDGREREPRPVSAVMREGRR